MTFSVNYPKSRGLDHCHSFIIATQSFFQHNYQLASKTFLLKLSRLHQETLVIFLLDSHQVDSHTVNHNCLLIQSQFKSWIKHPQVNTTQLQIHPEECIRRTARAKWPPKLKNIPPKITTNYYKINLKKAQLTVKSTNTRGNHD